MLKYIIGTADISFVIIAEIFLPNLDVALLIKY